MRSEAMEQHCIASSPRHIYHLAHTGIPLQDRPVPAALHRLCEEVRAVDLLGMFEEVSVVCQVRPRPIGRASAHVGLLTSQNSTTKNAMNPPPQPVAYPSR